MNISAKLFDSDQQIRKAILSEVQKIMTKAMNRATPSIASDIQNLVEEALRQEPEYTSLIGGVLRAELGIEFPSDVDTVIQALMQTLEIKSQPVTINNSGLKGGFILTMMKSDDLGGVIKQAAAYVEDYQRGYSLPWLEWLLLKNNQIIVRGYEVSYKRNKASRSGMALMIRSNKNWRVPPEYSGSQQNNWTTRAISRIPEDKIVSIIQRRLQAEIL